MLNFDKFIESSNAYNVMKLDMASSRISHAYMFLSADKNLLFSFAKKIACDLINLGPGADAEKNKLRIEKNIFPDVKIFGLDEKIDVSVASDIIDSAGIRPFEADKNIFILAGFDDISEIVQNKLLKTIEEPPKDTYFFLLCSGTSKILPTVLSRVKLVELDFVPTSEVEEMLVASGIDRKKAEIFASCSNGNATFAEKLAGESGFLEFFEKIISCLFEIKGSRDVLKYSSIFSAKDIDKDELFDIFTLLLRDISMILAGDESLVVFKNVLPRLKVISSSLSPSAVTELIELCLVSKRDLNFNANQTAVVDNFLFKIAEVKVRCRKSLV